MTNLSILENSDQNDFPPNKDNYRSQNEAMMLFVLALIGILGFSLACRCANNEEAPIMESKIFIGSNTQSQSIFSI